MGQNCCRTRSSRSACCLTTDHPIKSAKPGSKKRKHSGKIDRPSAKVDRTCAKMDGISGEISGQTTVLPGFDYRPLITADQVIAVIKKSGESSMFQTQAYLYQVLNSRRKNKEFIRSVRESVPYKSVIRMLKMYRKSAHVLLDPIDSLDQACSVDLDFDKLGLLNRGCDPHIPIYWKKEGPVVTVRFFAEVPSEYTSHSLAAGYAACWDETDLWSTWNPATGLGGPKLCLDSEQDIRTEFGESSVRTFDERETLLKFVYKSELCQHYKFFPPNTACIVDMTHTITRDTSVDDTRTQALLDRFPPDAGYIRLTDRFDCCSLILLQKETMFLCAGFDLHVPDSTPQFLVNYCLNYLLPNMVSNMFEVSCAALEPSGKHYARIKHDRKGLYKRVAALHDIGIAMEAKNDRHFSPKNPPTPDELLAVLGSKNLLDLDDEFQAGSSKRR